MNIVSNQKIAEQNRRAYDKLADTYTKLWGDKPDTQLADEFLGMLNRGSRILDVGCGPGHYGSYFIDRGHSVDAIDTSREMLRIAKDRDSRIRTRFLDMTNLDYGDHEFDALWVCASLPHVPKEYVEAVLAGFRRVLKCEGCLFVNAIIGPLDHRIETAEEMGKEYDRPGRFFQWYPSADVFSEMLINAGFSPQVVLRRNVTSQVLEHATCRTNSWLNVFLSPSTSEGMKKVKQSK